MEAMATDLPTATIEMNLCVDGMIIGRFDHHHLEGIEIEMTFVAVMIDTVVTCNHLSLLPTAFPALAHLHLTMMPCYLCQEEHLEMCPTYSCWSWKT